MSKRIVFSGIQPSGNLHIGNYIGAIRQWVQGQTDGLNIFCIVDLHAITVPQDPKELKEKTLEVAALLLAAGIDPTKSILFLQSHNFDHANLGWILNNFISMGQLSRMTQFKEKSEGKDFVSVGLFDYPALMAADILLYDTTEVPVGEDQKQHVELTRDVAERFNKKFGQTFVVPKAVVPKVGARIMSLTDPTKKMSKSDEDEKGAIYLLDKKEAIYSKIAAATTDSEAKVKYDVKTKKGISNLLEVYSQLTEKDMKAVEKEFEGKSYKEFKEVVANSLVEFLEPLQEKYAKIRSGNALTAVLREGASKASKISREKSAEVYKKVGFVI